MGSWIEKYLDPLKLLREFTWPVVIVSGLLLWGPMGVIQGLGLDIFINDYRKWIGITFLFFLVAGLSPLSLFLIQVLKNNLKERKLAKWHMKKLESLTPAQKHILNYYFLFQTRTCDLSIQNGDVAQLIADGFLWRASNVSYGGRGSFTFPVNIADWIWDYGIKHPELSDFF